MRSEGRPRDMPVMSRAVELIDGQSVFDDGRVGNPHTARRNPYAAGRGAARAGTAVGVGGTGPGIEGASDQAPDLLN